MPNYQNGKIYSLRSYQTDDIYIGSTTNPLSKRFYQHKSKYNRWLNDSYHYVSSFELFKYDDVYYELIECFPCNSKDELYKREGEITRETENCVNKFIAGRTAREWRDDNKEVIKEKSKEYYENNKEKVKENRKEYYENNQEVIKEKNKKYYEDNKEVISEKQKQYNEDNKEKIKEYYEQNKEKMKQYREANKNKYICEKCNYNTCNKSDLERHLKSKKHIKNTSV
jgi:hypothetical protein